MRHIPNILTCLRLAMIGVFLYFFWSGAYLASFIVFTVAFVTDLLDGYLARRNNWISDAGKVLDPLADKLFLIAALISFYIKGWLPLALLLVVVGKELLMILGGIFLYSRKIVVFADWFGKSAVGFFNVGVAATLLKYALHWDFIGISNIIVLSVGALLAVIAMLHYAKNNLFGRKEKEE